MVIAFRGHTRGEIMAESTTSQVRTLTDLSTLVSLSKRRGFVFQSSEIYGGLGSCWDYGPLGSILKQNVKHLNVFHGLLKLLLLCNASCPITQCPNDTCLTTTYLSVTCLLAVYYSNM